MNQEQIKKRLSELEKPKQKQKKKLVDDIRKVAQNGRNRIPTRA